MQSVPYLKKKKMYDLLKDVFKDMLAYKPELMKYATYRFYRGSEWLEGCANNGESYVIYKMYHEGHFISLDILKWNDEKSAHEEIERITYHLQNEKWIKSYQRTEAYQEIDDTKKWLDSLKHGVDSNQNDNGNVRANVRRRGR